MIRGGFRKRKDAWTFDQAKECITLYDKEQVSIEDLALHFNCSRNRIHNLLKSKGYIK